MRWFAAARHFNSNFDLMEFLKTDLISYSLGNPQKRIQSYPVFLLETNTIYKLIIIPKKTYTIYLFLKRNR